MKLEILELKDRKAKFVLSEVTPAFANSLRRAMISDVPKMAIDYVDIYDNTSVLFDEMLSLRLGLIPIKTNADMYHLPAECDCKGAGCALCQVSLTLSAEGPCVVHSRDMKSSDPETVPADANIPIVELKAGQKVVLTAVARLGNGKEHAKFQPVCASGYKNVPSHLCLGEMRHVQGMHRRMSAWRVQGREGQAGDQRAVQVLALQAVHRSLRRRRHYGGHPE